MRDLISLLSESFFSIVGNRDLRDKFIRYSLVGGLGVFVTLFFTWLFVDFLGMNARLAWLPVWVLAFFRSYTLHSLITWKRSLSVKSMGKFFSVAIVSTVANFTIYNLALFFFPAVISQLIAIGLTYVFNFATNHVFTFNLSLVSHASGRS